LTTFSLNEDDDDFVWTMPYALLNLTR